MAQKRMLDKKISVSEQVYKLADKGQIIFTWGVLHADDVGLLPHSLHTLKATVVPLMEVSMDEFKKLVDEIVAVGLWREFEHGGEKYYQILNFSKHQTLKKDRQPTTILKHFTHSKSTNESWENLFTLVGFQMEDNGFQMDTEEKGREDKRSKKKSEKNQTVKFTAEDMRLAELLIALIQQNNPEWQMRGNKDTWAENVNKLHRLDERTYEQIETMIRWVQSDSFWKQNILSTAKLREKFNDLIPRIKSAYQKQGTKKQIFV